MIKFWSPAANAYVEEPAPGYRDTDLVATDVTLVEKREAKGKEKLTDVLSASKSKLIL